MGKIDIIYKLDYMLETLEDIKSELLWSENFDAETDDYIAEAIDNIENIKYNVADMEDMED